MVFQWHAMRFDTLFLYRLDIDKTNWLYNNDNQGWVSQNYKFHDPRDAGFRDKKCPFNSYSGNALFLSI